MSCPYHRCNVNILQEDFDQSELGHGRGYMLPSVAQKVAEHILFQPGLDRLLSSQRLHHFFFLSLCRFALPGWTLNTLNAPKVCVFDAVQDAGLYGDDYYVPAVGQTQASTGSTTTADHRTRASDFPRCKWILRSFFLCVVLLQVKYRYTWIGLVRSYTMLITFHLPGKL